MEAVANQTDVLDLQFCENADIKNSAELLRLAQCPSRSCMSQDLEVSDTMSAAICFAAKEA
eukprot:597139-Amphidinium_carterae.1